LLAGFCLHLLRDIGLEQNAKMAGIAEQLVVELVLIMAELIIGNTNIGGIDLDQFYS